ncbi:hypothetical protein Q8A67_004877 [Cirrhinus molitorella]|uniref:Uncharacterized protein n=1 Tax=Cirrhinus molitorella TaxID=172907 RepID=A0AA88Q643_9TELE|nr:hypothetical protein Q8A67_004877 [Cirrhinus molitorella]
MQHCCPNDKVFSSILLKSGGLFVNSFGSEATGKPATDIGLLIGTADNNARPFWSKGCINDHATCGI